MDTRERRRRQTDGKPQLRVTAWVLEELFAEFKAAAARQQLQMGDVVRNAVVSFVAQDREERAAPTARSGKRQIARRMFRVLLPVMGPKEVLEEVLKIMPAHQVDRIVAKHRGEQSP